MSIALIKENDFAQKKTRSIIYPAKTATDVNYADDQELLFGGARGVMVIVTGYGHGDTSSIPGQD